MKHDNSPLAKRIRVMLGLLWMTVAGLSSVSYAGSGSSGKLSIYVVNYPLKYFAERIGGQHVSVVFPAPADVDPADWNPDAATIAAYQQSDLILLNGAGYAKWVDRVSLPRSKLVNTSRKFKDRYIRTEGAVTHSHGPKGEHAHEDIAFTTWIDFNLAAKQAQDIAKVLGRMKPELKKKFQQNYETLKMDLLTLDRRIKEIVVQNQTQPLIASHPVYDYFSRRYGLNIRSVHWEPDEIPNHEQWMELQSILKDHPSKWMIWEGDPHAAIIAKLESLGITSLVFDPCGNVADHGDLMGVMQQNVENLKSAFK
jgi:zinc transport system substrate-binding protein